MHPVKNGKITIRSRRQNGRVSLSCMVEIETPNVSFPNTGRRTQEIWVDWPDEYFIPDVERGDPFLLMCLPIAMRLKERLEVRNEVSQALLMNALEAMAIYQCYFPSYCQQIEIICRCINPDQINSDKVGSFYSGGVDSLFNIAESVRLNREFGTLPVTDLWLVQGMDIPLSESNLWEKAKCALVDQLQAEDKLKFADIRTNARDLHHGIVGWEELGFSAILGGIAKCFAPIVRCALIGSYAKYEDIVPHSSSPLVDPMWTCDEQMVRHFSCRVSRQEKVGTVANFTPHLLKGLRVCYSNPKGVYNCGVCEKCMRTQAQLIIAGCEDLAKTFDVELSAETLSTLKLPWREKNSYTWDFWRDIQLAFREQGQLELERALSSALTRNKRKRVLKKLLGRR